MVAGLNQMLARQSKMAIKNHNTEHRVKIHTYNLAVFIRHSLKYKNTVSQKTSYRDTELQIKDFKGRKGSQVERRRGRSWERG